MFRRLSNGPSVLPKEIRMNNTDCHLSDSLDCFLGKEHSLVLERDIYRWLRDGSPDAVKEGKIRFSVLGRGPSCNVFLSTEDFPNLTSFFHAIFMQIEDDTYVVDLDSANGTMVGAKFIPSRVPVLLNMRDTICFGSDSSIETEGDCVSNPFQYIYFKLMWDVTKPVFPSQTTRCVFVESYRLQAVPTIPQDISCMVCYEIMSKPYTSPCGHSACKDCLLRWKNELRRKKYRFVCPMCKSPIDDKPLYPNITLSNLICHFKTEN